jgi:VanZ family protein
VAAPERHDRRGLTRVDALLWALTVACAAATVWFSFVDPPPGAGSFTGADKIMHGVAYLATSFCFLLAAVWRPGRGPGRFPLVGQRVPFLAVGAGILIEILQGMTATRQAEVGDVLAELVGVLAAFAIHGWLRTRSRDGSAAK